jgi:predicted nucleic acid-binding protein
MAEVPVEQPPCYIFDTSSLIKLERSVGLKHMPDYPGKWLVVPSKVAKELDSEGAPKETKKWLINGKTATFSGNSEKTLYMTLRVQEKLLEDPDIEGIVIAHHRNGTYVVEEELASRVAQRLGIRTLKTEGFLREIVPRLPGFG